MGLSARRCLCVLFPAHLVPQLGVQARGPGVRQALAAALLLTMLALCCDREPWTLPAAGLLCGHHLPRPHAGGLLPTTTLSSVVPLVQPWGAPSCESGGPRDCTRSPWLPSRAPLLSLTLGISRLVLRRVGLPQGTRLSSAAPDTGRGLNRSARPNVHSPGHSGQQRLGEPLGAVLGRACRRCPHWRKGSRPPWASTRGS